MTIRDSINEIVKKRMPIVSIPAKVIAVDEGKMICDVAPLDGSAEIFDVLINAEQSNEAGIIVIPAIDSIVYITFVSKEVAFISLNSVIDKAYIKINDISLYVDADGIVFNDGGLDGLVKVNDLVSKLNTLESDLNTIKTAFASWVVAPSDGGAALKAITASWSSQQLTPTEKNDLENVKVKH